MYKNIPQELQLLRQWVCWRYEIVDGRETKVPYSPLTKKKADITNPETWATFQQAILNSKDFAGIGMVFTSSDPYACIDIDNKPDNPASTEELEVHERILAAFPSYTERSVGGHGYHIIIRGKTLKGSDRGHVGVYSTSRYLTFTGNTTRNVPIIDCQEMLDLLLKQMTPANKEFNLTQVDSTITDAELVERASNASNGSKFIELCNGKMNGYPSQSEADLALMSILAFYTPDNEQVRRIFRMTALGKRDKAQRDNYLNYNLTRIRSNEAPPIDLAEIKQAAERVLEVLPPSNIGVPKAPKPKDGKAPPPPKKNKSNALLEMPPGLISEIADYFYKSAIRPVREIALAAAIALTAGVCGRAFNISGTGLNQYLILLARTGSGKEGAMNGIDNLVSAVRATVPMVDQFLGPAAFSSGQALVKVLGEKPCFVSVLGEFGMTLQDISDEHATMPQRMLKKVLLDLYGKSGINASLRSSVYSDTDKNTKIVQAPNVTILGESTPETFFDKLDQSHISEGLIPRFTIVQYTGDRPPRNRNANMPPSEGLVQRFSDLVAVALTMQHKNACIQVEIDKEALKVMDTFDVEADKAINSSRQDAEVQLWNRAHLKALKIAALIAVGNNAHTPVITADIAQWATNFIASDINVIIDRFAEGDIGQGEAKQMSDLKKIIIQYCNFIAEEKCPKNVNEDLFKQSIIPASYLNARTIAIASYRHDKLGATTALKRNIQLMLDAGYLIRIPPTFLLTELKYYGIAYGIGKEW